MATKMNRLLLSQSGFQRRVLTVLQHMGLATLEDLAAQTESGLLRSARFGRKSLKDVKEVLATHGMTLQKESVSTKSVEARLDEARLEVHRLRMKLLGVRDRLDALLRELADEDGP